MRSAERDPTSALATRQWHTEKHGVRDETGEFFTSMQLAGAATLLWFLGGGLLAATRLHRYAAVLRTLPLGLPPDHEQWQTEWRHQLQAARLRRPQRVAFRITENLGPLLCWAPWSYLVLAPRTLWAALTSPERQSILRHELAHLQRGDLWKSLAIRVLALPQWFNPLARLAIRRFDEAGEWACDDAAARSIDGSPLTLANSLLRAAEFTSTDVPGALAANGGDLSRRIHRLVTPRFKEESKMKLLLVPMLLVAFAAFQLVRVERVVADNVATSEEAPAAPPRLPLALPANRPTPTAVQPPWAEGFRLVSQLPYVIEPPDILTITVKGKPAGKKSSENSSALQPELPDFGAQQRLVRMDGRIDLGTYGNVYVAGLTVDEALRAVAAQFSQTIRNQVSLEVHSYNSKVIYIITQDSELGDDVTRMPLPYPLSADFNVSLALAEAFGVDIGKPQQMDLSDAHITVCRPAPNGVGVEQKLLVKWDAASGEATPHTNYPLLPGDRLFVTLRDGTRRPARERPNPQELQMPTRRSTNPHPR